LSQTIDELCAEASVFLEQGFRAMKIRLGARRIEDDIERVRAVREAIGPDVELLTDANQGLGVKQAIRLGRALEPFAIRWFEEPVVYNDLRGNAEVRAALDIDIAGGETGYTRFGMQAILDSGAVDVLMPDLQRIGGLSEMRRVAAIASARHVPISPHLFTEHSLCLAGSEPGCISLEHMPWFEPLFNELLEIDSGFLRIPDRPGTGFTFNQEAIRSLACS
jgi:L-alanine-DL-glutamate epimerase-like enolase superfamily enzyme